MGLRNRSVVIKTRNQIGHWHLTKIDAEGVEHFKEFAETIPGCKTFLQAVIFKDVVVNPRTLDTWMPILSMGGCDSDFLSQAVSALEASGRATVSDDEPLDLAGKSLLAAYWKVGKGKPNYDKAIKLRDVTTACEHSLDTSRSSHWMKGNLRELGFEINYYMGFDWVKKNTELVGELKKQLEDDAI